MENWKTIKNYEGYSVSDAGEIKNNLTGKILIKHDHPKGYDQIYFAGHTFLVHKIVCEAFHENPENKPCVDHIDGNKKNNAASNLRWVSYKENNSNPNTKWKNSREPWNKGLTGLTWNWSEDGKQRQEAARIKGGETMKRKASERRKDPNFEESEKEKKREWQHKYREKHRDEINKKNLERYYKRKGEVA